MRQHDGGNEKGFILILALVTMIAMTVIGLSVVMNMTTDLQLSRNVRDAKTALQLAEAGINEAIARLHIPVANARYIGEKSTDTNYRTSSWNLNNSLGRDFNSDNNILGAIPSGQSYSVTIRYLDETNNEGFCDSENVSPNSSGAGTLTYPSTWNCVNTNPEVVMYGRDFKLSNTLTNISYGKLPVYIITATGTVNGTTRTIVSYIGASTLNTDTEAALNTNQTITWNGGNCTTSVQPAGSCMQTQSNDYPTYLGEDISEVKNMAEEVHQCLGATCNAAGDDIPASGALDTIVQDWGDVGTDSYSTLIYIENNGGKDVSVNGLSGRGILIVSGNLELAGNINYEGLIYVLGTLTISGGGSAVKNVTGGIMAQNVVTLNGSNLMVTYDLPTLLAVAKENSTSAAILWKRL